MKDDTKQNVLEIFNETKNTSFRSLEEAVEEYGMVYVFDCWLRYEGIVGYTRNILSVLDAVGFDMATEEGW